MTDQQATLLCGYGYDPLDRLVSCAPQNHQTIQRFYRKDRLGTEIQGQIRHSIFEHLDQPLAQQSSQGGKVETWLLATDFQQSVLHSMIETAQQSAIFCPYGHRTPESGLSSLLGFNGQRRDSVTGHYLLGNGYRAFNPMLMRFNSPDSLSPFGKGGVNSYAYCAGDPVNRVDPTGHISPFAMFFSAARRFGGNALSGAGSGFGVRTVSNVVSKPSSLVNLAGRSPVKNAVSTVSATKGQAASEIPALDLALPETIDTGRLKHALAVRVETEKVMIDADNQYAVLKRFVDSPPKMAAGDPVDFYSPAHIGEQPAARRLEIAARGVARAQETLDYVQSGYALVSPRTFRDAVAQIRSAGRRKSI